MIGHRASILLKGNSEIGEMAESLVKGLLTIVQMIESQQLNVNRASLKWIYVCYLSVFYSGGSFINFIGHHISRNSSF